MFVIPTLLGFGALVGATTPTFTDQGWGHCTDSSNLWNAVPYLYVDCRGSTPYSMKDTSNFPPGVPTDNPTSHCEHLCAQRDGCLGYTWSDWYSGGCYLHGVSEAGIRDADLESLAWGQANLCSRQMNYRASASCTSDCELTGANGNQGRNYRCYTKDALPVDCEEDEWVEGTCDKECRGGKRRDTRGVKIQPAGGRACGSSTRDEDCNQEACPMLENLEAFKDFCTESPDTCKKCTGKMSRAKKAKYAKNGNVKRAAKPASCKIKKKIRCKKIEDAAICDKAGCNFEDGKCSGKSLLRN